MKKIFCLFFTALLFLTACGESAQTKSQIDEAKIYLFYSNSCSHCHDAMAYINQKYPDLEMVKVNIATPSGYELLFKCAEKFKLGSRVGTPLFCMGNRYIMGWAPEYQAKFDAYVKPYLKK